MVPVDLKYDPTFDIQVNRDIYMASQLDRDIQLLQLRLKGSNPDFVMEPTLCSSFEDYIGENNDSTTGNLIQSATVNALTGDQAFSPQLLSVSVYPTDFGTIQVDTQYQESNTGKSQFIYDTEVINIG